MTLTAQQIGLLRAWIDAGAKYPAGVTLVNTNVSAETAEAAEAEKIAEAVLDRGKDHWAFKAPVRPPLPRGEEHRLGEDADRRLRPRAAGEGGAEARRPRPTRSRCSAGCRLDLIGLPPTLAGGRCVPRRHSRRTRTSKQVERLLASPHYGERWGRHWLDAARYADSDGYEKDKPRQVWFYRDWVVDALNRDLPYDRFVIEQIAGDLLPNADAGPDRRDRLPAQLDDQRGRRHRPRAVPHGGDVRPHGRRRQGRPRPDHPVRPVPQPQVRPDHAGGVLPAVRLPEQRPRGAARRLHARRADAAWPTCAAQIARDRGRTCSTRRPTGEQRMAAWEDDGAERPAGVDRRRGRDRRRRQRRQRYLPQADGSILAAGLRADEASTSQFDGHDRPARTSRAFRLELLTDPNLPLRRAGPVVQGHVRADRVRGRGRRRRRTRRRRRR